MKLKQYNIFGGVDDVEEGKQSMLEKFGGYDTFVEKFKDKHTTDDCYTPPAVYDAVLGFCKEQGWVDDATKVIRPFYPGEDFTKWGYPTGCAVVDNPPFSIYTKIVRWFIANDVRFFLFGPQLTLKVKGADVCYLPVNAPITYDNGAVVNTGFVTNMLPGVRIWTAPALVRALKSAAPPPKLNAKNTYPLTALSPALIGKIAVREVDFLVASDQCHEIQNLDSLKRAGKSLFGGGWLLSERAAAERAAAERAAAERAAAERAAAERAAAERAAAERAAAERAAAERAAAERAAAERAAAERAAAERAAAERAAGTCVQLSPSEQAIVKRLSE